MSPTFAAKPRAGTAAAAADDVGDRFAPLSLLGPLQDDDPAAQWKAQRKLKHARDFGKRHGTGAASASLKPKFKQHGHHHGGHHGIPLQELRRERDLWLASEQQLAHSSSNGRSIPDQRRRDKAPVSAGARTGLSKSVPATAPASWPPASGVARDDDDDDEFSLLDENDHPNSSRRWTSLSSSAPKESLSRSSSSSKREARPMTLFESASFFNESGHLLSHDNFEELGSSPEMAKRKLGKRRVGRRKTTADKTALKRESPDALNCEELVLELMAQLLPHVDVGKELNLRLLTGQPRSAAGDVFHFEHDDSDALKPKAKNAPLEIDVLKFQAALTKMVVGAAGSSPLDDEPLAALQSLDGDDLVEHVLSDHWINQTLLATVQLDVLVQYDRFAVLLALFRALPHRRCALLDAVTATALAIFHHQGADATRGQFADVECVSVKGLVAFLSALLATLEHEARVAADATGDGDAIATHAYCCDQLSRAIELLLRSSPGKPRRQDESNLLDKYSEDSLSLEATTYGALGEVLTQLAALSPVHGERLLRWLVRKWPARNVQLQLFFVRFTGKLLVQFLRCGLCLPADVVAKAFAHVAASITSLHFLIAQEACGLCGDMALMDVYLSRDPAVRATVASALHQNARAHWNDRIREMSDEHFDMLLDLA